MHGYDLVDAAFLDPTRFVSIADEKVARVFEASRTFVTLSKHIGILSEEESEEVTKKNRGLYVTVLMAFAFHRDLRLQQFPRSVCRIRLYQSVSIHCSSYSTKLTELCLQKSHPTINCYHLKIW